MGDVMMWVFAILIVLAMAGVAVVAAGHGEPLAPAYDDRPDAVVPADRPLVAEDLRKVRFTLAFRGYRMAEVDELLSRLAAEMEHATTTRTPSETESSAVAEVEDRDQPSEPGPA